jgi:hypothetical protein
MRYRMVSDESKRAFREWLDRCPDPQFLSPRRSAGAFDVAMPDERGEQERRLREKQLELLALLSKGIPLRVAHALFEYFRPKADTEDELRQLWAWLSSYVVSPPRRNGNAHT